MSDQNKKKRLYRICAVLFALVLIAAGGTYAMQKIREQKAQDSFEALRGTVTAVTTETEASTESEETVAETLPAEETELAETEPVIEGDILQDLGITIPEPVPDWDAMKKQNEDIYAWLYIPGTKVDYPILQHPTNDNYYLDHNLDGSRGYPGCIYTEKQNARDFTDHNTLIYGHNMRNGTMFQSLHDYQKKKFFDENRYCYVYLPDGSCLVYRIFAAYVSGSEHILNTYDCETETGFAEYLSIIGSKATKNGYLAEDVNIHKNNRIITMSTCIGDNNKRYLVQAVLVNDPALTYTEQCTLFEHQ